MIAMMTSPRRARVAKAERMRIRMPIARPQEQRRFLAAIGEHDLDQRA
jgi:hypothetical protein